ncbi:hypothetical protein ALDI51_21140 [Alicycliphilus denitrificans]|nr:Lrp/AsnC family transcriptional regulator [Alicycliphilus denitrificans]OJW90411.1 MAG: hypothetical protein BGO66_05325 [Alicycliphilus sp. 69-12]BCN38795.1 hypothetical protein ALDI51_21140 [Alicycliphilus denitrificans]
MHTAQPPTDLALLNSWQRDFPLCREPFALIGQRLGLDAGEVLSHYRHLQRQGSLSRIGAVFAPGAGGASLLAAMAVPPERLEAVAAIVSSHAGVNHNYEREHATNLWFVATGPDAAQVDQLLRSIEMDTGLPVQRLPMLRPYRIDTGFDLRASQSRSSGATHWAQTPLQAQDQPLAALAEQGLPLVERPYDLWAEQLQQPVEAVLHTLQRWLDERTVSRFGVVVRHHELGFTANAMTVFDVPESEVDACGEALARVPGVTLAYQRARTGGWPYNLYCMVHGRDRESVRTTVAHAVAQAGLADKPQAMLFSLRRFKQTGARRFTPPAMPRTLPTHQKERCMLTPEDARLIDHLHGGFPLVDRPFAAVGQALGWSEERVIERLHQLLAQGVLTRFGPLFQIERAGGQFVLAAIAVPEERFDVVNAVVNSFPEVAHNYRRTHRLNMWFVVAAESPALAQDAIARIEDAVGLQVFAFPKEEEYFVELRLPALPQTGERHGAGCL